MSARQPQSIAELEQHLQEQVGFLIASADSFDRGFHAESKRLATTIRVLVHDTSKSHSLLTQLGRKTIPFWDSAMPLNPGAISSQFSLVAQYLSPTDGSGYFAPLDDPPDGARQSAFKTWWETPVFLDQAQNPISRRNLVLWSANQDGGAHVDPALDPVYANLTRSNSLSWVQHLERDGAIASGPLTGAESAAVRQIAHEILKTLDPTYTKQPSLPKDGMIIAATSVSIVPARGPEPAMQVAPASTPMRRAAPKVGRNDPCPCASGKKFKKCHGT